MEKLTNKKHEKKAKKILKELNGLSTKEISDIIYRVKDLVEQKSKLISL